MQIKLNGEQFHLPEITTIASLVEQLQLGESRYAVEVNREIIPRGEHSTYELNPDDHVEIVQAIGGG